MPVCGADEGGAAGESSSLYLWETLPPVRTLRGIGRPDAATNNAERPVLLCGANEKSASPAQHHADKGETRDRDVITHHHYHKAL